MLFRLVGAASNPLSLLTVSFAHEGFHKIMSTDAKVMSQEEKMLRADTTRRRLSSRCKGLLETPDFKSHGPYATVQYLHRIVKDFLRHSNNTFDPDQEFCAAFLLHLKMKKPDGKVHLAQFVASFTGCIEHSVRLDTNAKNKNMHIETLNELERICNTNFDFNDLEHGSYLFDALISQRKREGHLQEEYRHWPVGTTLFMDYALVYPLYSYVEHWLENTSKADLQSSGKFILLKAARREDVQMVTILLDILLEGGVNPDAHVAKESMTVWQLVLLQLQIVDLAQGQAESGRCAVWAEIIRIFLEHRADPCATVDDLPVRAVIMSAFECDHVRAGQLLSLLPKLQEENRGGSKLQFQGFKRLFK
ncbi:hypothetical protein LARI1_G001935 [Lachnellula arida]|uniref:DUF7791 domain-containing protein n=1 Tax=Lachnellula arida TaxID=1316785 RepID=A0A8T9BK18_9HELO|nr:hypothetical protein LARI1_G001935 [Lachnellula arida]